MTRLKFAITSPFLSSGPALGTVRFELVPDKQRLLWGLCRWSIRLIFLRIQVVIVVDCHWNLGSAWETHAGERDVDVSRFGHDGCDVEGPELGQ